MSLRDTPHFKSTYLVLGLGGRLWWVLFGGQANSGSVNVARSLPFLVCWRLSYFRRMRADRVRANSQTPYLTRFLHLLLLDGVRDQNIVIAMTVFDPAALKNLGNTIFFHLWYTWKDMIVSHDGIKVAHTVVQ